MGRPRAQPETTADENNEAEEPVVKNPYAPTASIGPDEELPGIEEKVAGVNPVDEELETDNLGVPAGYVSVYNGPVSQPVIPGDPVISSRTEPLEVEAPERVMTGEPETEEVTYADASRKREADTSRGGVRR